MVDETVVEVKVVGASVALGVDVGSSVVVETKEDEMLVVGASVMVVINPPVIVDIIAVIGVPLLDTIGLVVLDVNVTIELDNAVLLPTVTAVLGLRPDGIEEDIRGRVLLDGDDWIIVVEVPLDTIVPVPFVIGEVTVELDSVVTVVLLMSLLVVGFEMEGMKVPVLELTPADVTSRVGLIDVVVTAFGSVDLVVIKALAAHISLHSGAKGRSSDYKMAVL